MPPWRLLALLPAAAEEVPLRGYGARHPVPRVGRSERGGEEKDDLVRGAVPQVGVRITAVGSSLLLWKLLLWPLSVHCPVICVQVLAVAILH